MKNELVNKRNELIRLSKENTDDINMVIYVFAINKKLDFLLKKLDDKIVKTNVNSIVKKGYLTSVEHFYQVLYHFINYINTRFWFVSKHKNYMIEQIINTKEVEDVLFHKEYIHDNNTIPYYKYHFNRAIVSNFYRFLKTIPITEEIYTFLKRHNIDLESISLDNKKDINSLFNILRLICICNNHDFGLLYIFDYKYNPKGIHHISGNFEGLIDRVNDNEEIYLRIIDS